MVNIKHDLCKYEITGWFSYFNNCIPNFYTYTNIRCAHVWLHTCTSIWMYRFKRQIIVLLLQIDQRRQCSEHDTRLWRKLLYAWDSFYIHTHKHKHFQKLVFILFSIYSIVKILSLWMLFILGVCALICCLWCMRV